MLQRTSVDAVYQHLVSIVITEYLQRDTVYEKRKFLQHLLDGADWSKPVLNVQQREAVNRHWQEQINGDEYRQLDEIFKFIDPEAYFGREDYFDIEVVMSKHGGKCTNRDGFDVRIVSTENPDGFPILGAIFCIVAGEEVIEGYQIDGSQDLWYRGGDLVMPDAED